jgi:CRP/FNR family nitrogen fixation transcriptional regulator
MYRQLTTPPYQSRSGERHPALAGIAHWERFQALIALEQIGTRLHFAPGQEIYAAGEQGGSWYKVVRGTVRICKFLADGRRHIAEFCFAGDSFGFEGAGLRGFSAEAVGEVSVIRFSNAATERLAADGPELARHLREVMLKGLAMAQTQLMRLGRMTACERVVSFLIELAERQDSGTRIELAMSRCDLADHLGLTIETVCRVLADLKRRRLIALSNAHWIELLDRDALAAVGAE